MNLCPRRTKDLACLIILATAIAACNEPTIPRLSFAAGMAALAMAVGCRVPKGGH